MKMKKSVFIKKDHLLIFVQDLIFLQQEKLKMLSFFLFPVHTGGVMKRINSCKEFMEFLFLKRKCLMSTFFLKKQKKRSQKDRKTIRSFSIHEEAGAGLIYWHPKGARIRNEIEISGEKLI
jgi:hypothetical protein